MSTILVTGSAGFIGSNLCRALLDDGDNVIGIDNYVTGTRENTSRLAGHPRFRFHEFDITYPAVQGLFDSEHIDFVYHLACPTGVPNLRTLASEMLLTCSVGTFNILEIAKKHDAKLLFTSTAEVYGQPEVFPQHEGYNGNVSTMGERSAYEEGKRFSEAALAMFVRTHGLDARVVRVFNTYGPGMSLDDRRVIPQFIKSIQNGRPIVIYGDGSQTRCHLFVEDLVRGLRTVMEKGLLGEAYNVGSDTQMTVLQLAELLLEISGSDVEMRFEPHFIEDHRHRRPLVEKARSLGWKQHISIEEGLRMMVTAYLERPAEVPVVAEEALPLEKVAIA